MGRFHSDSAVKSTACGGLTNPPNQAILKVRGKINDFAIASYGIHFRSVPEYLYYNECDGIAIYIQLGDEETKFS